MNSKATAEIYRKTNMFLPQKHPSKPVSRVDLRWWHVNPPSTPYVSIFPGRKPFARPKNTARLDKYLGGIRGAESGVMNMMSTLSKSPKDPILRIKNQSAPFMNIENKKKTWHLWQRDDSVWAKTPFLIFWDQHGSPWINMDQPVARPRFGPSSAAVNGGNHGAVHSASHGGAQGSGSALQWSSGVLGEWHALMCWSYIWIYLIYIYILYWIISYYIYIYW